MARATRRRRGRISVSYNATVVGYYGTEIVPVDSFVAPGETLRYAYSSTLDDVIEAPEPMGRRDFLWAELRSFQFIVLACVVLLMIWYAYDQFRLIWIVSTGRYTVNGKPPA